MESGQPLTFGDLLRRCRLAAGLSQEALAERARLSAQAVSTLERGLKRAPYRETVRALAGALGLSAEEAARLEAAVPRRRGPPSAHQRPVSATPPAPPGARVEDLLPAVSGVAETLALPTGTPTFLLTDIEGSAALWEQHPVAMRAAIIRHDALITEVLARYEGRRMKEREEGDRAFAVFAGPSAALAAACALQQALLAEPWPVEAPLRVQMGLHSGEAALREGGYYGVTVNRCARIRSLAHGGQVLLSQATHDLLRDGPPEGVNLRALGEHRLKGLERPEAIYQVVHPLLPAEFPPPASSRAPRHNLPRALTSLVGRERERGEVSALLGDHRLVTLVGSGGVGKTRLALAVAAELVDRCPDGVWLVELAPLADPALLLPAVAQVLGLREEPRRSLLDTLADHLKERRLLLVLDNCEHLLAACAALVDALLRACPQVIILATSREALGIGGERPWRVPSLGLPDPGRPLTPERALACEAVQLFVQRARVARPEFTPTGRQAELAAQVCGRLDGIPLAIELAATRLSALALDQLAARLDDRFRLLTGGSRTALPRQRTLLATLDWSYALLTETEQVLMRRLSVFAGGWALEAAEAVCADDGIAPKAVLDLLAGLVGKSLVQAVAAAGGGMRYGLLETVRQYGREKLAAAGEEVGARECHLRWCLVLAERAEPWIRGPEQGVWLAMLDTEHDNLRAALDWAQAHERTEAMVRLGGAQWWFWWLRGHMDEGRRWLEAMLRAERDPPAVLEARLWAQALHGAGWLSALQRAYAQATALLERSLEVTIQAGDTPRRAIVLIDLGNATRMQGQYRRAIDLSERAAAIARRFGHRHLEAGALGDAGAAWHEAGEERRARPLLEAGLALSRVCGDAYTTGWCLTFLGRVTKETGEHEAAAAYLAEALVTFRDLGHPDGLAFTLEGFAGLAARQGRPARASRLFGQAEVLREANRLPIALCDEPEYDRDVRSARDQLGETPFAIAWTEGRTMSLEQSMSYALTPPREPTSA